VVLHCVLRPRQQCASSANLATVCLANVCSMLLDRVLLGFCGLWHMARGEIIHKPSLYGKYVILLQENEKKKNIRDVYVICILHSVLKCLLAYLFCPVEHAVHV